MDSFLRSPPNEVSSIIEEAHTQEEIDLSSAGRMLASVGIVQPAQNANSQRDEPELIDQSILP